MEFTINISRGQLEIITKALDLYSRTLCGQLEEVPKIIKYADFTRPILNTLEKKRKVDKTIETLKSLLFPEIYPAQYGICNRSTLPRIAAIAYDIYQVLHRIEQPKYTIFKTSDKEYLPIVTKET